MKIITSWTETDLQAFVDSRVQESVTLDYKRLAALDNREEISKDISAFANSAGGVIVYGIVEEGQFPSHVDLSVPQKPLDRETLENVITSTIYPRVDGLLIQPIPLSSGATAYVVDIPAASVFAPHQAKDKRYYRRFNFKSVPMEDYEVRDAFKKSRSPFIRVRPTWKHDTSLGGSNEFGIFTLHLENLADEPSLYTTVQLVIDSRIVNAGSLVSNAFHNIHDSVDEESGIRVVKAQKNLMVPTNMPLFRGRSSNLVRFSLLPPKSGPYLFGYHVASPGFVRSEIGLFSVDGWKLIAENASAARMIA